MVTGEHHGIRLRADKHTTVALAVETFSREHERRFEHDKQTRAEQRAARLAEAIVERLSVHGLREAESRIVQHEIVVALTQECLEAPHERGRPGHDDATTPLAKTERCDGAPVPPIASRQCALFPLTVFWSLAILRCTCCYIWQQ